MSLRTCGLRIAVALCKWSHQANLFSQRQSHSHASNFPSSKSRFYGFGKCFCEWLQSKFWEHDDRKKFNQANSGARGNSSLSLGWGGGTGASNAGRGTFPSGLPSTNTNKNYSNASSLSHNYNQNVGNRIRDNVTGYTTLQRAQNFTLGKPQNYTTSTFGKDSMHNTQSNSNRNYNAAGMQSGVKSHRLGGGRPQLERTEQPRYQPTYESTHALSSNLYANGANQNCGNVMTGRSSTRVSAPPGGYTQWSLG